MATPNESDMPLDQNCYKKVGSLRNLPYPDRPKFRAWQVSDLILQNIKTVDTVSDWLMANGYGWVRKLNRPNHVADRMTSH